MSYTKVLYEELRPDEFLEKVNDCPIAYLPLGTLEWHGLHLPLGADGIQSKEVFERIAAEAGGIVLPMLFLGPDIKLEQDGTAYYGMDQLSFEDGHPQQLEGSAYYMEEERFSILLDAIMHNLSRAGFKIVVGHGHGPSTQCLSKNKQDLQEKYGIYIYNLYDFGYKGIDGIITDHAAQNETSLIMALRPELASMDKLSPADIPVAVWGRDPRVTASAESGKKIIDSNVKRVVAELRKITAGLPKGKRALNYHHVKSLLDQVGSGQIHS